MATSSEAFKSFKSVGVVVFANSKGEDYGKLPEGVRSVRAKGGNTIPMVFVTTADGSKGLDAIPYAVLKEDTRKAARTLRKTLEEVDVVGEAPKEDEPTEENKVQDWTNTDGKTITASVKSLEDDRVQFEMKNGKLIWYPIEKLSEESQEQLKESE